MEGTTTRQRALDVALDLFSRKGYHATSMNDIAEALGIKAPSLYKHFKGKEELYAALTPLAEDHYRDLWSAVRFSLEKMEAQATAAGHLTAEALEQATGWFAQELSDPRAQSCRLLADADRWLWNAPLELYAEIFSRLIDREILRRGEPRVMAMQFIAPLLQLLSLADGHPELAQRYQDEAGPHIRQFHRIFARREQQTQPTGRFFRR